MTILLLSIIGLLCVVIICLIKVCSKQREQITQLIEALDELNES